MTRFLPGFLALLLMQTLSPAKEATFYLGTNTGPGKADGILVGHLDTETGKLGPVSTAAPAVNPTFLTLSPGGKFLYAGMESGGSAVGAYRVEPDGRLVLLNQQPSGGKNACHVWLAVGHIFVSNYNSGDIAIFPIQKDGSLGQPTEFVQFTGTGPDIERQTGPHAHGMITVGNHAYACDLGTDNIWSFAFDPTTGKLKPTDPPAGRVSPGAGPRHAAASIDGNFLYANNEMGLSVTTFRRDSATGLLTALQTLPTLPDGASTTGVKTSEIVTHPSGKWLYVSNRMHDSLTVYAIGADGLLTLVENVPSHAHIPRGFAIDPSGRWLVVGGQRDNTIAVFRIDEQSGKLTDTGERASAGSPVCVAFVP